MTKQILYIVEYSTTKNPAGQKLFKTESAANTFRAKCLNVGAMVGNVTPTLIK